MERNDKRKRTKTNSKIKTFETCLNDLSEMQHFS